MWETKRAYSFVRERLGEDGLEMFVRAEVDAHKREYSGPIVFLLSLVRWFSPGLAFEILAKQVAYRMQWLTEFYVSELTQEGVVFEIPRCKLVGFPGTEDMCLLGCYWAWPAWMGERFAVGLRFGRRGDSCTMTLTP